jgi:hypothetical protein
MNNCAANYAANKYVKPLENIKAFTHQHRHQDFVDKAAAGNPLNNPSKVRKTIPK